MRYLILVLVLFSCSKMNDTPTPSDDECHDEYYDLDEYKRVICPRSDQIMNPFSHHEVVCRCPKRE